jgi:general L-amino acid transport system permease protein
MAEAQPISGSPKSVVKPPVASVGVLGWMRANLFNSWFNSLLTIVVLFVLWHSLIPFVRWAFIDSLWLSTSQECQPSRAPNGAVCR